MDGVPASNSTAYEALVHLHHMTAPRAMSLVITHEYRESPMSVYSVNSSRKLRNGNITDRKICVTNILQRTAVIAAKLEHGKDFKIVFCRLSVFSCCRGERRV
jgi:hypothetical protein